MHISLQTLAVALLGVSSVVNAFPGKQPATCKEKKTKTVTVTGAGSYETTCKPVTM